MATLLMVQHGQPLDPACSQLSWRGIVQARRLGVWLARMERVLDLIVCGPQGAQRDSARHMVDAAGEAGRRFAAPVALEEFAEVKALAPVHDITASDAGAGSSCVREALLEQWARGALDPTWPESYEAFRQRVQAGLSFVAAASAERRVAIVTSPAVTALSVQVALGLDATHFARLERALAHGSVTELALFDGRAELITFNSLGHLAPEELSVPTPFAPRRRALDVDAEVRVGRA